MLLYIMVALIWWYISLQSQNAEMTQLRLHLKLPDDPAYSKLVDQTLDLQRRKHAQYIGEGSVFLILILVGAVFVYRAIRRQWRLSQQQQNFTMAITHELKTPISVVRLNLETFRKRKLEPQQQEKLIQNTLHEADRLNDLCDNILLADKLEGGNYDYHKETWQLNELAEECVRRFTTHFPDREIALYVEESPITGEALLIKILINNLLENALKYSPKNMPVEVKVSHNAKGSKIAIADLGPGIPDAEKREVFQKFYRMGNENTRSAKGTGLGLYLCKKIAAQHKADITLGDNHPSGAVFTVTFPKNV